MTGEERENGVALVILKYFATEKFKKEGESERASSVIYNEKVKRTKTRGRRRRRERVKKKELRCSCESMAQEKLKEDIDDS